VRNGPKVNTNIEHDLIASVIGGWMDEWMDETETNLILRENGRGIGILPSVEFGRKVTKDCFDVLKLLNEDPVVCCLRGHTKVFQHLPVVYHLIEKLIISLG